MYDLYVSGYDNGVNKLHLFDLATVDEGLVKQGIDFDKTDIQHNLTLFLYPDDSDRPGRLLRVYQQYFMVSCAAQLILKEVEEKGWPLTSLHEHAVIQINDTHPSMVIPELIRLLTARASPWTRPLPPCPRPAPTPTTPSWRRLWRSGPWTSWKRRCPAWCPSSRSWTAGSRRKLPRPQGGYYG